MEGDDNNDDNYTAAPQNSDSSMDNEWRRVNEWVTSASVREGRDRMCCKTLYYDYYTESVSPGLDI